MPKRLLRSGVVMTAFLAVLLAGARLSSQHGQNNEASLYELLVGSDLIAVGKIAERTPVGRRLSREQLDSLTDLGLVLGGTAVQMEVREKLCNAGDLRQSDPSSEPPQRRIFLFGPRNRSFFREPVYTVGEEVLIFAAAWDDQAVLVQEFKLEPGRTYYQAYQGRLGLHRLSEPRSREMVRKIATICESVRSREPAERLRTLKQIAESSDSDPELKETALKLIDLLQKP